MWDLVEEQESNAEHDRAFMGSLVGCEAFLIGAESAGTVLGAFLSESPYNPGWFVSVMWSDGFESLVRFDSVYVAISRR